MDQSPNQLEENLENQILNDANESNQLFSFDQSCCFIVIFAKKMDKMLSDKTIFL